MVLSPRLRLFCPTEEKGIRFPPDATAVSKPTLPATAHFIREGESYSRVSNNNEICRCQSRAATALVMIVEVPVIGERQGLVIRVPCKELSEMLQGE